MNERMLEDAPLLGTGAGTFAALAPIYREMDDQSYSSTASTAAAAFAIELGRPLLWLIAAAALDRDRHTPEGFAAARARLVLSSDGRELSHSPVYIGFRQRRVIGNSARSDRCRRDRSCARAK